MIMETWRNGESGGSVKRKIDNNFNKLSRYSSNVIRSLTTDEINLLTADYRTDGTIVFNKTKMVWQKYNAKKNEWENHLLAPIYSMEFLISDWSDNKITIPFSTHTIPNPIIALFIQNDSGSYESVLGGVSVDENFNVILSSDLPFMGKVVIR